MLARFAAMAAVVAATAGGCKKDAKKQDDPAKPVAGEAPACAGAARSYGAFTGYHDDYAKALACAKSKNVPLVIDMWAPWCHTCLSMQAYVMPDPRLAEHAPRFVLVALDTDKDVNAAAVAKFPPAAWPTYFVVSPTDESIQSRFVGSSSVEQFAAFLDDGERGFLASTGKPLAAWEAKARDGDQAASRKEWKAAADAYLDAVGTAPADWPRRPDALVSAVSALSRAKDWRACVDRGYANVKHTGSSASASDYAGIVLGCASQLLESKPPPDGVTAANEARTAMVGRLSSLVNDAAAPLTVDDRSDALMYLREGLEALGKKDEAKEAATTQRKLLDDAAAAAKTPLEASTYNWPRSEVYLYLGVPLELVPALEKSTADLPEEYDPPYRLAWIYWKAGKLDLAKEAIGKALARVYGPRKTRALAMLADIEKARGDVAAERKAREEIVATWQALPAEAQSADAIAKAKADLAAMDAGSGSAK